MDLHPIQGGVGILLVASCYRNRDKCQTDGPLGSYEDLLKLKVLSVKIFWTLVDHGIRYNSKKLFGGMFFSKLITCLAVGNLLESILLAVSGFSFLATKGGCLVSSGQN